MSAAELRNDLAQRGVKLAVHGDMLRYSPRSEITPDLLERMSAHKEELLAIVQNEARTPVIDLSDPTAVWQATLDRLEGDPHFSADILESLRQGQAIWISDS
jgi:TubC N-terminal docking domain